MWKYIKHIISIMKKCLTFEIKLYRVKDRVLKVREKQDWLMMMMIALLYTRFESWRLYRKYYLYTSRNILGYYLLKNFSLPPPKLFFANCYKFTNQSDLLPRIQTLDKYSNHYVKDTLLQFKIFWKLNRMKQLYRQYD